MFFKLCTPYILLRRSEGNLSVFNIADIYTLIHKCNYYFSLTKFIFFWLTNFILWQ